MLKLISLIGSVIEKAQKDHVTAFSAQAAFFTILSFFPFLIVVLSLMRFFPLTPQDLINLASTYLPDQYSIPIIALVKSFNKALTTTYMSITIITLLWAASKAVLSLMTGLNTIHEIPEKRNYFYLRFISTIYIALFAVAVLFGMVLLLFGNSLLVQLYRFQPILENQHMFFATIRFLLAFLTFLIVFIVIYRFLPSKNFKIKEVFPGALFSSIGWMILSFVFSIYFDNFSIYNLMYGSLTGILLTIFWLYFCMMFLFIGAEINRYFIAKKEETR